MKNNSLLNQIDQIQSEISYIKFHSDCSIREKHIMIKQKEKQLEKLFRWIK